MESSYCYLCKIKTEKMIIECENCIENEDEVKLKKESKKYEKAEKDLIDYLIYRHNYTKNTN